MAHQATPAADDAASLESPVFHPFRRLDRYGVMGNEPQPWPEQLRMVLFAMFVLPIRACICIVCLVLFYLTCWTARLLLPEGARYRVLAAVAKVLCRICLFGFGFVSVSWVKVKASPADGGPGGAPDGGEGRPAVPCAIVSNHISWADILIHMQRSFPSFVARINTKDLPIIGIISQMMGCVYVDRSSKTGQGTSHRVRERMKQAQEAKSPQQQLLLFPEGTTTNGRYLLPFKTGAFLAGAPVQPVIIKYSYNWTSPAWESIAGKRHILLMLCSPWHTATCYQLPVYVPSSEEQRDPVKFAANLRSHVLEYGCLEASSSTFEDKMRFHAMLSSKSNHL